ncbi:hypothetical protein, partial [Pleionea sediminis]|uniref:hypothetical protein n=1 Tax=Pleionea sediminis TaxID=2569479 RepID=UPI00197B530B
MSEWSYAASTVNISSDKMADIFKDVNEKIGDFAATGGGPAANAIKQLNLNVDELIKLSPEKQLLKIAEGLESVGSQAEKSFYLEELGNDATYLLPLLDNGAEKLKSLQEEARAFGVSISELDAAKMKAAERSLERVGALWQGFGNQLTTQVSPILEVIGERIVHTANDSDVMGDTVRKAFYVGARGVGIFADGLHGINILLKGAKAGANILSLGMAELAVGATEAAATVFNAIMQGITKPLRWTLEQLAELPGRVGEEAGAALKKVQHFSEDFQAKVPASLEMFRDAQAAALQETTNQLQTLLAQDLPSKVITENIESIMTEADEKIRAKILEIRESEKVETGSTGPKTDEQEAGRFQSKLERMQEQWLTEEELLLQKYERDQMLLDQALDKNFISEWQYFDRKEKLTKDYGKRQEKLEANLNQQRIQNTMQFASSALQLVSSFAGESFGLTKTLGIAESIISITGGVAKALNNPYPANLGFAAQVAAQGATLVSKIKGTNLGSSGSSVSLGGSAPAAPSVNAPERQYTQLGGFETQQQNVAPVYNFHFENFNALDPIADAERFAQVVRENDIILVDPNSRNGQELREAV